LSEDFPPGEGCVLLAKGKGWVSDDLPEADAIEQLRARLLKEFGEG
jgi:hypothetical protein